MPSVQIQERNSNKKQGRRTMKATELRIGNWVKMKKSDPIENYQISAILEKGVNSGSVGMLYEIIEPIPLTEEWLERFGFEKDEEYDEGGLVDYRMTLMKGSLEFVSFWNSEQLTGVNQPQTGIDVEYVHQLQNLYFALTGQELQTDEIKKKVK